MWLLALGQVLIQPSRRTVCNSGTSKAPQVGGLLQRPIEGPVDARLHGGPRTGVTVINYGLSFVKISEPPEQDLVVWISWKLFALSLCLHGAAN